MLLLLLAVFVHHGALLPLLLTVECIFQARLGGGGRLRHDLRCVPLILLAYHLQLLLPSLNLQINFFEHFLIILEELRLLVIRNYRILF